MPVLGGAGRAARAHQDGLARTSALVELSDTHVRHGFVRKVYGILGAQLLVTTLIGGTVMEKARVWSVTHPEILSGMLFASFFASIAVTCVFCCSPRLMRESPTNYLILAVFTLAESVMVGMVCASYTKESVLIALAVTTLVVLSLSLFACQTTYDFTGMGPYLFTAMMVLCGFSFALWIASMLGLHGPAFGALWMAYSACGTLLFSFYIVYDTQQIVGGKHAKHQFSVDDYAFAAINLYIDIIQLFLHILRMLGDRK